MIFEWLRKLALFLVGLGMPIEYFNVVVAGVPVTPAKVVTGLLLVVALLYWATSGRPLPRNAKTAWVLLFGVAGGVSLVSSLVQGAPPSQLVKLTVSWYTILIFYFLITYVVVSRQDFDSIGRGLAVGVPLVVASALLGLGTQTGTSPETQRMSGIGGNPNESAANLMISIPILLALMASTRRLTGRLVFGSGIAMALSGIAVSLSRSAVLAVFTVAVFYMWRAKRARNLVPVLIVAGLFLFLLPQGMIDRFSGIDLRGTSESSAQSRIDALPAVADAFASSPLVGVGLGFFRPWAQQHGHGFQLEPHNAFLEIAVGQGLLGLLPYVAIVLLTWRDYSRVRRLGRRYAFKNDPELMAIALRANMLQISYAGLLVFSMFGPIALMKGLWMLFALSTAFAQMARQRAEQIVAEPQARDTEERSLRRP